MQRETKRLDPLTSLRFFAAAMIVVLHIQAVGLFGVKTTGISWGQGVSFFFVLSGFILTHVYPEARGEGRGPALLAGRVSRVSGRPISRVSCSASCCLPIGWKTDTAAAHLFMVQAWVPLSKYFFSYNAVSWSVSVEFLFYLLFPLLIANLDRNWWIKLALSGAVVLDPRRAVGPVVASRPRHAMERGGVDAGDARRPARQQSVAESLRVRVRHVRCAGLASHATSRVVLARDGARGGGGCALCVLSVSGTTARLQMVAAGAAGVVVLDMVDPQRLDVRVRPADLRDGAGQGMDLPPAVPSPAGAAGRDQFLHLPHPSDPADLRTDASSSTHAAWKPAGTGDVRRDPAAGLVSHVGVCRDAGTTPDRRARRTPRHPGNGAFVAREYTIQPQGAAGRRVAAGRDAPLRPTTAEAATHSMRAGPTP